MALGTIAAGIGGALASGLSGGGEPARRKSIPRFNPIIREPARSLVGRGSDAFENAGFVGLQPTQERALSLAEAQANRFLPAAQNQTPGQTLSAADETLQRTLQGDFLTPDANPALGATIDAATGQIVDEFQRDILPQLGSAAQRAGAFGGSRQGLAEARSADQVTENIADTTARMLSENFARERGLQQRAMQFAPSFAQAERNFALAPSRILQGVGSQRRQAAQQEELFPQQQALSEAEFLSTLSPGPSQTTIQRRAQPSTAVSALRGGIGGMQLFNAAKEAFS